MATRAGATYSENNMGFGEGRVIHTIRLLETCPAQALIVLEEPETSLHEFAQYEFAKYLMDVSFRRGHQIILSTHSSAIVRALPTTARKLLSRKMGQVKVYDRVSSIHIRNALTEVHDGNLIICVEDEFAQSFLREIIREKDKDLLRRVKILPFGDAIAVHQAVLNLRDSDIEVIGVRDGDQTDLIDQSMFTLPGDIAPEKLIFESVPGKQELVDRYQFDLDQHLAANPECDHHDYAKEVSKVTGTSREVIEADCIRAFMQQQPEDWANSLLSHIRTAA